MLKDHWARKVSAGLVGIIVSIYLTGCSVPLNHIGAFSQASADLAKCAADAYNDVNETTIERRIFDIAATEESPDDTIFDKILDDQNLSVRISLLKGVENYSKALGKLASADFRKDIDIATKDLYGSLDGLQNTYATATKKSLPFSKDNFALIATAIDAIGTGMAENKRREALKTVVIQADLSIQESMRLVSEELPMLKEFLSANLDTIWTEKVKAYQKEVHALSFDQRVTKLRDIRKARELSTDSSILIDKLSAAGTKISKAHAVLREAVSNDKFTSEELVAEIKSAVETSKAIKEFHDKLLAIETQGPK